ncbi:MAG: MarR family transcriptional regulator [Nitriliruptoraceae bacterium]|nr:MarR family transcriptional regulator [Nitriliruptoraceae bacterium]
MAQEDGAGTDPWLTDEEQRTWRALVAVALRLPAALDRQLREEHGLTHVEYWVLALLSEADDDRLPLTALAAQANASLSRLSHVVTRLEERGWVTRERAQHDARVTYAVLTAQGRHTVEAAAPDHVAFVRALVFDPIDPDAVVPLGATLAAVARTIDGHAAG